MSLWVNAELSKPPVFNDIILYVGEINENEIIFKQLCIAFYADEYYGKKGFYIRSIDNDGERIINYLDERKLKAIAWTFCPKEPNKDILTLSAVKIGE